MTPMVEGDTLVYCQGEQEHVLTVGTAAWFAWLENASTLRHTFHFFGLSPKRQIVTAGRRYSDARR